MSSYDIHIPSVDVWLVAFVCSSYGLCIDSWFRPKRFPALPSQRVFLSCLHRCFRFSHSPLNRNALTTLCVLYKRRVSLSVFPQFAFSRTSVVFSRLYLPQMYEFPRISHIWVAIAQHIATCLAVFLWVFLHLFSIAFRASYCLGL